MEILYKSIVQVLKCLNMWFDCIFMFSIISLYFYLVFKKGSSAMFKYFVMCLIWSSSLIWMGFLPPKIGYLLGDDSPVHGYMITLGGMLYGVPLTLLSFFTWLFKHREKRANTKTEVGNASKLTKKLSVSKLLFLVIAFMLIIVGLVGGALLWFHILFGIIFKYSRTQTITAFSFNSLVILLLKGIGDILLILIGLKIIKLNKQSNK